MLKAEDRYLRSIDTKNRRMKYSYFIIENNVRMLEMLGTGRKRIDRATPKCLFPKYLYIFDSGRAYVLKG